MKTSANEALAATYEDHEWKPAVLDTNTTEGIKLTLKAHSAAIQTLADHMDGKDVATEVKPEVKPEAHKVAARR